VCREVGFRHGKRNGEKSGGVARSEIDIFAPIFTVGSGSEFPWYRISTTFTLSVKLTWL
jgi:hypothetical protein